MGAYLLRGMGDSSCMQTGQTTPNITANTPTSFPAAISAADAAAYCNAACVSSVPGFTETVYDNLIQAVQSGQIIFTPGDTQCSGIAPAGENLQLVSVGTGLGLTTANILASTVAAGTAAGTAIPIIGTIVGSIVGLFIAILQHHALVTKAEQNAECALIPAANNYLTIIGQSVTSGQATPAQAVQALQSLFQNFLQQAMSNPSWTDSGQSKCSALCVYAKQLCAIVAYQSAQYQNMAATAVPAAAAASGAIASTTIGTTPVSVGSTGLTVGSSTFSLPELAVGALVLWFLFK